MMAVIDMTDPATIADMVAVLVNEAQFPADGRFGGLSLSAWVDGENLIVTIPNPVEIYPPKVFELSLRRVDHGFPPPETRPQVGGSVGSGLRDRADSQARADYWTLQLANDPVYGVGTGFVVGVAQQVDDDGIWPLIWVPNRNR